jgi:hypothetical protein
VYAPSISHSEWGWNSSRASRHQIDTGEIVLPPIVRVDLEAAARQRTFAAARGDGTVTSSAQGSPLLTRNARQHRRRTER